MPDAPRFPDPPPHMLVVDDERMIRWSLRAGLEEAGARVEEAATLREARSRLDEAWPDLVLLDLRLPDGSGLDLLAALHEQDPDLPVLIITAFGSLENAVEAMRRGAQDYVAKPFELDELVRKVGRALEHRSLRRLRMAQERAGVERGPVAESPAFRDVLQLLERVGRSGASTVLLTGESGVGKGLAARLLHRAGGVDDARPFVPVPCTAIAETLLESELFGHERGAFTDARESRQGLAELAHGGTLFLDEIGDLPASTQAKMLTLLEERTFRRVGGNQLRRLEARVVAATHRDLEAEVAAGRFRADLYYRLRVVPIHVPPLRERREDVLPLANTFLESFRVELGSGPVGFEDEAARALADYRWPGNVRELRNAIERACLLAAGSRIGVQDLPTEVGACSSAVADRQDGVPPLPTSGCSLEELERAWVAEALRRSGGNRSRAARLLGMNRDQIRYRLDKYGLEDEQSSRSES